MKIKHKGYFVLCIIDILLSCIGLVKGCLIDGRTERIFNLFSLEVSVLYRWEMNSTPIY